MRTLTLRSRRLLTAAILLAAAGTVVFLVTSGSDPQAGVETPTRPPTPPASPLPPDAPLAPHRSDLLDLAFKVASAFPEHPHVKTRSQAQEDVVAACLELDQPRRAMTYAEDIKNWRRGAAYAAIAHHCAKEGETDVVRDYLDRAAAIAADVAKDENAQDWHRDRIRASIAKTHLRLGQVERAAPFTVDLLDSEAIRIAADRFAPIDAQDVESRLTALSDVVAKGDIDRIRCALATLAVAFHRQYEFKDLRDRLEERIKGAWKKLPIVATVDLGLELVTSAVEHEDAETALRLTDEIRAIVDGARWQPEDRVSVVCRLAVSRHRAGRETEARREVDAALAEFDAARERIVDVFRGRALRPVAEAYQAMGYEAAAMAAYRRAVEEGVANVHSRPRAEDLCATCLSMALRGVEPDAALRERMYQIYYKLGNPW